MKDKKFKLSANQIVRLIPFIGGCIATDRITVDGMPVGYMYREEPNNEKDSGWRFFSGDEDQPYIDNVDNSSVYDVNTIANYDKAIIPYLFLADGVELERIEGTDFFQQV